MNMADEKVDALKPLKELFKEGTQTATKYFGLYEAENKAGRRTFLKKLINKIYDDLVTEGKVEPVDNKELKAFIKEIRIAFDSAIEGKEDSQDFDAKRAKDVDAEVREKENLNKLLTMIFGSTIKIRNRKITSNNFKQRVEPSSVTVTGKAKDKDSIRLGKLIGTEQGKAVLEEEGLYELSQEPEVKEKLIQIMEYADEFKAGNLGVKDMVAIQMRGTVKELLGWGRFADKGKRESIYSSWGEVSKKHEVVVSKVRELANAITQDDSEMKEKITALKKANKIFEKNGQYVGLFKPQSIAENGDSEVDATMKVITAYVEGKLGLVDSIPVAERGEVDESDRGSSSQYGAYTEGKAKTKDGFINMFKDEMDILGYYYVKEYMDGIFINEESLPNIKRATKAILQGPEFGFESSDQMRDLDEHLNKLERVKLSRRKAYMPLYILEGGLGKYTGIVELYKKNKDGVLEKTDGIPPSLGKLDRAIRGLFEALIDVLVTSKMRVGDTVSAPAGQKDTGKRLNYGEVYSSRPTQSRELKNVQKEVREVLQAVEDYFYRPLFDPSMNLNLDYPYKNTLDFKELLLLTESDFALAYKTMFRKTVNTEGDVIDSSDLSIILRFLIETQKPNMQVGNIKTAIINLRTVFEELFEDDKKLLDMYEKEMASYLGHLFAETGEKKRTTLFGIDINAAYRENPIEEVKEMTIIMALQDFLTDTTAKAMISGSSKTHAKILNEINELKKMEIENKILKVHDSIRILKGLPIYYGRGSLSSMDDIGETIDTAKKIFDVDIIGTEIVKMVEEVDSFSSISKSVGVSEEVVYFVKANFR